MSEIKQGAAVRTCRFCNAQIESTYFCGCTEEAAAMKVQQIKNAKSIFGTIPLGEKELLVNAIAEERLKK